jgi:hypothetical protein
MIEGEDQFLLIATVEQLLVGIIKKVNKESEGHHINVRILGPRAFPRQHHPDRGFVNESLNHADSLRYLVDGTRGGRLTRRKRKKLFDLPCSAVNYSLPLHGFIRAVSNIDIRAREHPLHDTDELDSKVFECGRFGEFPKSVLERFYLMRELIGESVPRDTFLDGHASLLMCE